MATVFTKIIAGELPGRFVWGDERCVAFLSINPLTDGHTLVVPRAEVDHWLDLDEDLCAHLHLVAMHVGRAIHAGLGHARVGTSIVGFEVPHVHVHVFGANSIRDFDWSRVAMDPDPDTMDRAAETIRAHLREAGHGTHVPD